MSRRLAMLASLACLSVAVAFAAIWAISESRLVREHAPPPPRDSADYAVPDVERGRRLVHGAGLCSFCHGHDLSGKIVVDDFMLGRLYAPNLTSGVGGAASRLSDQELENAIRWGVDGRNRTLVLMPSEHLQALSVEDLAAVIGYIRALPPVDRTVPSRRMGPLTRVALVLGLAPELLSADRSLRADRSARLSQHSLGAYLAEIGSCRVCHGEQLVGGLHPLALPDEPTPPNLTSGGAIDRWSNADFRAAMRTGVTPSGHSLDPRYMPWPHFSSLEDEELDSLFAYLIDIR